MPENKRIRLVRDAQRGVTLLLVALSLVVLLGICALAIDLVWLYVGRSEAQRAADAAALAGASVFVSSGCTSVSGGCVAGGPQEAPAMQRAIDVGSQNPVGGQAPTILSSDVTFAYPTPEDPTITVKVARDATHGGPMPTFFIKIFGVTSANISAVATAEAFNPSGSDIRVAPSCLKPWILPNCDPCNGTATSYLPPSQGGRGCPQNVSHPSPVNPTCHNSVTGEDFAYFVTPSGAIANPGPVTAGVLGEAITLKPGQPSSAPAPSQFYPIQIPPGNVPALCPACTGPGGGSGGASLYTQNIECCNTYRAACYSNVPVNTQTGNVQGPTESGVECLINETKGVGTGQDTLCGTSVLPPYTNATCGPAFQVYGGPNNPITFLRGQPVPSSSSPGVVSVPIYDGAPLSSGGGSVTIIGFIQFFLDSVDGPGQNQGNVHASITNVAACKPGSSGGNPPVISAGGSPIPVRLIHQ